MDNLLHDLRYGFRILARSPGFTAVAVLTLALGIGANTAIFSVIDAVLLSPFPYPGSERMVSIWNGWEERTRATLAEPEFEAYRDRSVSFEAMAAYGPDEGTLSGRGDPVKVSATFASSGIFRVLGVEPFLGRFYTADEDVPGGDPLVVVSHELWQNLGSDPALVGSTLQLDGVAFLVLGVMPPGIRMPHDFQFGGATDIWLPLQLDPAEEGDWGMHGLAALGRIKEGLTIQQAQTDIDRVVAQLRQEHAGSRDAVGKESFRVTLLELPEEVVGDFSSALVVLLGAVAFVLLIACANVANLLLARAESRRRELALRTALGAARRRIVRQLLTESVLLALAGGLLGIVVANWMVTGLVALDPGNIPRLNEVRLDRTVLGFSLALSLLTGIGFGLVPAFSAARRDVQADLRSGDRSSGPGVAARGVRQLITVAEVALAVVLIVGAGLLIRSLWNLQSTDPGFRTADVLTVRVDIPSSVYRSEAESAAFFTRLNQRLSALPGVASSGGVTGLPLANRRGDWNFYPEGRVIPANVSSPRGDWQVITPGYFETMGMRLLRGRAFGAGDTTESPLGIIFNQTLVDRYYTDDDPIGTRIRLGGNDDNPWVTVIGVVSDVRHRGLDVAPRPEWYLCHTQAGRAMGIGPRRSLGFAIASDRDAEQLMAEVRSVVSQLDPDIPVGQVQTMDEIRARALAQPRFATVLLAAFALLAVVLGSIGIFGVISHLVARRSREIGVRMALGARRREVVRMVLGEGLRLTGIGLIVGTLAALAVTRVLGALLHGVSPADPATFGAALLLLVAVATAACLVPARRAAGLDPIQVLRDE